MEKVLRVVYHIWNVWQNFENRILQLRVNGEWKKEIVYVQFSNKKAWFLIKICFPIPWHPFLLYVAPKHVSACICLPSALTRDLHLFWEKEDRKDRLTRKKVFLQKCLSLHSTVNVDDFEDRYLFNLNVQIQINTNNKYKIKTLCQK